MRLPVVTSALLLVAGCVTPAADSELPAVADLVGAAFVLTNVSTQLPAGEPVVAVDSEGRIYIEGIGTVVGPPRQNVNKIWRSDDDGATWKDVTPPFTGQDRSNDGFVAVGNGDRVYGANVYQLTFQLFRSDDHGDSWTPLPAPRLPALMHRHWIVPTGASTVHVTVEGLPPAFLPAFAGQSPASLTGTPNDGMWYARSDDLGRTWSTPIHIDPRVNFAGQSNMVVSEDGQRLFVARYADDAGELSPAYLSGKWYLLASEDAGRSWERREMFALTGELSTPVPSLALASDGALHFAWAQGLDGVSRVHLATTTDSGRSWSALRVVAPEGGAQSMVWALARADRPLALMWYEADEVGVASQVNASWRVRFAEVDAEGVRAATVTPESVHEGNICSKGPACGPGQDRRLLDYPWMAAGPDGRAHLAFPSTKWDRPTSFAVHAVEGSPRGTR